MIFATSYCSEIMSCYRLRSGTSYLIYAQIFLPVSLFRNDVFTDRHNLQINIVGPACFVCVNMILVH